ncbi:hypothetical protein L873DRAFT_1812808 [Choiromyces venosus 120613-1]|uniref:Uncharacterized protein n=1 Tax=Choiromyces venosus 120613-1 TaxID=1336337 RepID=A0A3N4JB77_9PEZI|nr:hypothetical protein L873DRAFT_1812808 [Choiromyces venosus 120613-1]
MKTDAPDTTVPKNTKILTISSKATNGLHQNVESSPEVMSAAQLLINAVGAALNADSGATVITITTSSITTNAPRKCAPRNIPQCPPRRSLRVLAAAKESSKDEPTITSTRKEKQKREPAKAVPGPNSPIIKPKARAGIKKQTAKQRKGKGSEEKSQRSLNPRPRRRSFGQ